MKDHATICEYLKDIDRRELIQLGGTLGLDFSKIRRMQYIPEDMIAAWLRREDNVLERSGEPTWKSLIHCLQKIGQKGVAKSIEGDLLQSNVTSDTEQCKGNISVNQSTICSSRVMLLILTMAILLLCCLYCLFWPTLVYKFNLDFHSKTLRDTLENFAGREKDVAYLTKLLDPGSGNIRIVCIVGPPGFGKSALAIHVGHEMVKRNVVVHYIDFVDFQRNHSVQQELAEKVLGSSGISTTSADFNRLLLWARDRYWYHLLILDNCDDAIHYQKHDFQSMLRKLTGASVNVNILITSRTEAIVDKMSIAFPISELSTEAACELLKYREQYGVTLTLDQKKHVANLTGNVPLALDIFKLLLDRIGAPSPDELIRELKEELIETLSPSDFNSSLRITAVLDLSYKHLNPKLQNVSRQLTIFPGSFSLKAGVIVLGYQYGNQTKHILKDIDESLRCLVRSSLLQYNQRVNRFQYHQLIREYFLHISTTNDTDELLPAFNFYYAELLMYSCVFFKQRFDVSSDCN